MLDVKFIHIIPTNDVNSSGVAYTALNHAKYQSKYTLNYVFCLNGIKGAGVSKDGFILIGTFNFIKLFLFHGCNNFILHFHGFWSIRYLPIIFFAFLFRLNYIVSPHGSLEYESLQVSRFKKFLYLKLIINKFIRKSKLLIAYSQKEGDTLTSFANNHQVMITRIGVDLKHSLIPENFNITKFNSLGDRYIILCVSRIHKAKGIDILMRSWSKINNLYPNWQIVIAGPDDGYLSELLDLRLYLNLESSVTIFGKVDDIEKSFLFSLAKLFILPSLSESFGIVVAEALSYKIPVITTIFTPWSSNAESTGCFCVDADPISIGDCISNVINTIPSDINFRCELGYEYVASNHSWEKIALSYYIDMRKFLL